MLLANGNLLKNLMDAIRIHTRQFTDHPKISTGVLPNPSPCKALIAARLFTGRLQIGQNSHQNVLPEPLLRTH